MICIRLILTYSKDYICYDSKLLELGSEVTLYGGNTRELDRELCIRLSILYTKGTGSMLGLSNLP